MLPSVAAPRGRCSAPSRAGSRKRLLEAGAEELPRQLQHAAGVLDDLARLDAADVVEEPAAARVHELRVPLQLEQLERRRSAPSRASSRPACAARKRRTRLRRPVEDHADVVVARLPRVREQRARLLLPERRQRVAQRVERLAQGRAPRLVPARTALPSGSRSRAPPLDAVGAAPRGALEDPRLVRRRVPGQELAVVGQPGEVLATASVWSA